MMTVDQLRGLPAMGDKSCVIILGLDELASAIGRRLLLSGYAVAMHAATSPTVLRRRMAFSDAWYDGAAVLEGVEARRAGSDAEFLGGLRSSMFIPVLTQRSFESIARWPWDAAIDARQPPVADGRMELGAELTIALGPGADAGDDCDIVIETGGNDPGAVVRRGGARSSPKDTLEHPLAAPLDGLFHGECDIGDVVAPGDIIGFVGSAPVVSPCTGRVRGLLRGGSSVRAGDAIAEIVSGRQTPVNVSDRTHRIIARSVAFMIEIEQQGRSGDIWNGRTGFDP